MPYFCLICWAVSIYTGYRVRVHCTKLQENDPLEWVSVVRSHLEIKLFQCVMKCGFDFAFPWKDTFKVFHTASLDLERGVIWFCGQVMRAHRRPINLDVSFEDLMEINLLYVCPHVCLGLVPAGAPGNQIFVMFNKPQMCKLPVGCFLTCFLRCSC